jgi:hypothetical protein
MRLCLAENAFADAARSLTAAWAQLIGVQALVEQAGVLGGYVRETQRGVTIVTSNLPFGQWDSTFAGLDSFLPDDL